MKWNADSRAVPAFEHLRTLRSTITAVIMIRGSLGWRSKDLCLPKPDGESGGLGKENIL